MRVNSRQFLSHKCLPADPRSYRSNSRNPTDQSTTQTEIGHYKLSLKDCIGKGAFSKVYSAINVITKERVAVKVARTRDLDELSRDLLRNQMNIIKEMKHPHLLCCLDIFITQFATYIVTEFCQGDLEGLVKTKLRSSEVWRYFGEIVKGYAYMKEQSYIHRDLKPANILIKNGAVKVADFGFAKLVRPGQTIKEKYNLGSPMYMAPESLKQSIYSEKTQVWSLGIILYEMLTAHSPYLSKDQKSLCQQMSKLNLTHILTSSTPKQFHEILKGCLSVDPAKRFSVSQLITCMNLNLNELDYSNTPLLDKNLEYFKQIDKVLVNEINYVEFLRRFVGYMKIREDLMSQKVRYLAWREMRGRVGRLEEAVEGLGNVFALPMWQQYTKKQQFLTFQPALKSLTQYKIPILSLPPTTTPDRRFESSLLCSSFPSQKLLLNYQYYLRCLLTNFKQQLLESHHQGKKQPSNEFLLLMDFTLTAYQLNEICIEFNLEVMKFAERSCLGVIVNSDMLVDGEMAGNLLRKMEVLEF